MRIRKRIVASVLCLYGTTLAAQQPQPAAGVPKLVRFSGSFRPADGTPAQTVESLTVSVYRDQSGGDALWREIQNVVVDSEGRYSVLMGTTQNEGMPVDLFSSGEPRWLGVQFNRRGEAEQPRTLLVSVPYALKSVDADTLGGKPASAYMLAAPAVGNDTATVGGAPAASTITAATGKPKATPANSGMPNYIGKFANTTDLIDSAMYEVNGNLGISTTNPLISLDARTGPYPQMGMAQTTDYLTFFASDQFGPAIYWDPAKDMRFGKGGSALYSATGFVEQMRIKSSNGYVGIGTQTPRSKLDVAGDINLSGSLLNGGNPILTVSYYNGNTGLGLGALNSNTSGYSNTAIGSGTLSANTAGYNNTATGQYALIDNLFGNNNTANGQSALFNNTFGNWNTADGVFALLDNTTGNDNSAAGSEALYSNTTGNDNVAAGFQTMYWNATGSQNTANGAQALAFNNSGDNNTASGYGALYNSYLGDSNTADGWKALYSNTTGSYNIAIGIEAAINVNGANSNNIHIGSLGETSDNATIRIGAPGLENKFFAAGIRGVTTGSNNAVPVLIDANGQLGTVSSSRRFKEDIADMGASSHDLMRLRPVTFRYKEPFADGSKPIQYGLIAEEVAEVYPDLVAHSADGQIETVKYQVLDSMLLNEVQRQQAEIRRLEQKIEEQNRQNHNLHERLAKLEAALAPTPGESRVPSVQ